MSFFALLFLHTIGTAIKIKYIRNQSDLHSVVHGADHVCSWTSIVAQDQIFDKTDSLVKTSGLCANLFSSLIYLAQPVWVCAHPMGCSCSGNWIMFRSGDGNSSLYQRKRKLVSAKFSVGKEWMPPVNTKTTGRIPFKEMNFVLTRCWWCWVVWWN